jgi:plastocyanin
MRSMVAAAAALLGFPAAAHATTTRAVQAVDSRTLGTYWTPSDFQAQQGDTIQWRLTQPGNPIAGHHDIWIVKPGADPSTATQLGTTDSTPVASAIVDQTGTYLFYCSVHGGLAPGGMHGQIEVGTDDPGPPVDPGTPWSSPDGGGGGPTPTGPPPLLNPTLAPQTFETGDLTPPSLQLDRVSRVRRGVRVRVTVSEPVTLTIRLSRGKKAVKTRKLRLLAGTRSVTVAGVRSGRYALWMQATDRAQLQSKARWARVRV